MKTLLALLAAFVLAEAVPAKQWVSLVKDMDTTPFIMYGQEASPGQFPHQLSLMVSAGNYHTCGAVLVEADVALTAAHCINPNNPDNYYVRAGQHVQGSPESEHDVSSITQHEDYNSGIGSYPNDIAILFLASSADLGSDNINAISCADAGDDIEGSGCQISGWGTTEDGPSPDNLMYANIDVISNADCSDRMDACNCGAVVIDSHICVYDGVQGSCSGDSGGPLTCNNGGTVNGVTSWGISGLGGCQVSYPSVYTRVSSFGGWLSANGANC